MDRSANVLAELAEREQRLQLQDLCLLLEEEAEPALRGTLQLTRQQLAAQEAVAGLSKAAARSLVRCLMMFDNLLVDSAVDPRVQAVRLRLRQFLFDGTPAHGFSMLDQQLIGQPLRQWQHQVEVSGFVDRPRFRSRQIAEVRLPGYVFQEHGPAVILRKAQVLVAE